MKTPFHLNRLLPAAIALALLFIPMGVYAFDFTPDASRVVSDPAYLPLEKQFFEGIQYLNGNTQYSTYNNQGNLFGSNHNVSNAVSETVEYGITDDLTLRFAQAFDWNTLTETPVNGAATVTNAYGFTDPSFDLIWRAVDQKKSFLSWDILAEYAPNFYAAQSSVADEDGTAARGGDTATLGSAFSLKSKSLTLYLEGTATYLDNRSVLNPINNITTTYNSSFQYSIQAATQLRFSKRFSLNLSETHVFLTPVGTSYTDPNNNLISANEVIEDVDIMVGTLNFHVIPNRFVISLIYNHQIYGDEFYNNSTLPNFNATVTNKTEDIFSGEIRCVFD